MITREEAIEEMTRLYEGLESMSVEDLTRLGVKYLKVNAMSPGSAKRILEFIKKELPHA